MTDNRILSIIRDCRKLDRQFHSLTREERRSVLVQANGAAVEGLLLKIIRRLKRQRRKSETLADQSEGFSQTTTRPN